MFFRCCWKIKNATYLIIHDQYFRFVLGPIIGCHVTIFSFSFTCHDSFSQTVLPRLRNQPLQGMFLDCKQEFGGKKKNSNLSIDESLSLDDTLKPTPIPAKSDHVIIHCHFGLKMLYICIQSEKGLPQNPTFWSLQFAEKYNLYFQSWELTPLHFPFFLPSRRRQLRVDSYQTGR